MSEPSNIVDIFARSLQSALSGGEPTEIIRYAAKHNPNHPSLFETSSQPKLDDLGPGHWITIHSQDSGGSGHGGHHVFLGEDGKMKTGKFAGQTMTEAFHKLPQKQKRTAKRGEKLEHGQVGLFETESQPTLPGVGPGNHVEVDAIKAKPVVTPPGNESKPKPPASEPEAKPGSEAEPEAKSEAGDWDSLPEKAHSGFENNVLEPLRDQVKKLDDIAGNHRLGPRYAWEVASKNGAKPGDEYPGSAGKQRWIDAAKSAGFENAEELANNHPELKDLQSRLDKHRGWGEESPQSFDDKIIADRKAAKAEPEAKPAAKPSGIVLPKPADNSDAKAGDQLGLFGEVSNVKSDEPPKLKGVVEAKGKAQNLFDTHGNADQMDLFGDGVMPDDMVLKPEAAPSKSPQEKQAIQDFWVNRSEQAKPEAGKKKDEPQPVADSEPAAPAANPFRDQADAINRKADSLVGGSAHDKAMASAFPFGTGRPGNASSRQTSRQSDKRIDATINNAIKSIEIRKRAKELEAKAHLFDNGMIDANGNPTEKSAQISADRKAKVDKANTTIADYFRETLKPGDLIHAQGSNNALEVKRVNKKTITTDSGTTWSIDDLVPSENGKPIPVKEFLSRVKQWQSSKSDQTGPQSDQTGPQSDQTGPKKAASSKPGKKAVVEDFGDKIGGARKDLARKIGPRAVKDPDSGKDLPSWRKRYHIAEDAAKPGEFFIADKRTNEPIGAEEIGDRNSFSSMLNKKLAKYGMKPKGFQNFTDRESAEKHIAQFEVNRNHIVLQISKSGEEPNFAIHRVINDRKRPIVKDGFKSAEEAAQHMRDNAESVIEHKFPNYETYQYLDRVERTGGKDHRAGKDVKGKDFQDAFNFRGGEFGKWQTNKDGQTSLNHAYDALHDLSETLGLPPRAMSLDGKLAIGFGSRGTGGKDSARAHYEPGASVINLTKMKGAGSLAHEWLHALDHHLTRMAGKDGHVTHELYGKGQLRDELHEAIRGVHKAIASKQVTSTVAAPTKSENILKREAEYEKSAKAARENGGPIPFAKGPADHIWNIRKSMEQTAKYKNKTLDKAKLAAFDAIANKIESGDFGKPIHVSNNARSAYGGYSSYENLEALNQAHKKLVGRGFHNKDDHSAGTKLYWDIKRGQLDEQRAKDASAGKKVTNASQTDFLREARELDNTKGKDYYALPEEMMARAFEGYIQDKLSHKGVKSQYLGAKASNKHYETHGLKPFPEGEERESINAAFDKLFSTLKHRPRNDDRGDHVELYSANSDKNRQAIIDFWVSRERYAGKDQMAFEWNESDHPREPSGASTGGQFAASKSAPTAKAYAKPVQLPQAKNSKTKVRGTTDSVTTCQRCGRSDLKKTVCIERLDAEGNPTGDFEYYGSDCASKITGRSQKSIEKQAAEADYRAPFERSVRLRRIASDKGAKGTDGKGMANYYYNSQKLPRVGSYLATDGKNWVRVNGQDPEDVAFWKGEGYKPGSEPIAEDKKPETEKFSASHAQREAGNYKMGHIRVHGLDISIETKRGQRRRPEWPPMPADYGYIRGTRGRDGDHVDVFVGTERKSELVFVVDQVNQDGKFDEHKCLIGFSSQASAIETYKKAYSKGWKVGPVSSMTIEQFKNWIKEGNTKKKASAQVSKFSASSDPGDYLSLVSDLVPLEIVRYEWNSSLHPRQSSGNPHGGEFSTKNRPGGVVSERMIESGYSPNSTRSVGSAATPATPATQPAKPQMSRKREIAEHPDTIKQGHSLHLSSLDETNRAKLIDWNQRISALTSPMGKIPTSPLSEADQAEAGWGRVDKNAVRGMLAEMNQMDKDARAKGVNLSDFVNANRIIPRNLAERLDGGTRFFDPEKIRDKLKAGESRPSERDQTPNAVDEFKRSDRTHRAAMMADPAKKAAIERAMGLRPSAPAQRPAPPSEVARTKAKPEKPAAQPELAKPDPIIGISKQAENKLNAAVSDAVGENASAAEHFKGVAVNAWKQLKDQAEQHNEAYRQILGFFESSKTDQRTLKTKDGGLKTIEAKQGENRNPLLKAIRSGSDPSTIPQFDEMFEFAQRNYPGAIAFVAGESETGSAEDGLYRLLREGTRAIPEPFSDEVIERASDMVGANFWESLSDSGHDPELAATMAGDQDDDIPFSSRKDFTAALIRYWVKGELSRYGVGEFNENEHPRDNDGKFTRGFRIHPREFTEADIHDNHISRLWDTTGFTQEESEAKGLSASETIESLVDYFAGGIGSSPGRGADLRGAHLVEFLGEHSGDVPFEAENEVLLHPRQLVKSTPIKDTAFFKQLKEKVNYRFGDNLPNGYALDWDGDDWTPVNKETGLTEKAMEFMEPTEDDEIEEMNKDKRGWFKVEAARILEFWKNNPDKANDLKKELEAFVSLRV